LSKSDIRYQHDRIAQLCRNNGMFSLR